MRIRITMLAAAGTAAVAMSAAACSSSSSSGSAGAAPSSAPASASSAPASASSAPASSAAAASGALKTAQISGVTVVTNAKGFTLYSFAPDTATKSNCNGACAQIWPPVTGAATAGPGVTGKLGTITRSDGSTQATYDGHPLYTYAADTAPGQATGNGVNVERGRVARGAPRLGDGRGRLRRAATVDTDGTGRRDASVRRRAGNRGPRARRSGDHRAAGDGRRAPHRRRGDPPGPVRDRLPVDPDYRRIVPAAGHRGVRARRGCAGTGSRLAAAAGAVFALATLGGYLLSVWIGLFGFKEVDTTAGIAAGVIEVAAFAALAVLAVRPRPSRPPVRDSLTLGGPADAWLDAGAPGAAAAAGGVSVIALVLLGSCARGRGRPAGDRDAHGLVGQRGAEDRHRPAAPPSSPTARASPCTGSPLIPRPSRPAMEPARSTGRR